MILKFIIFVLAIIGVMSYKGSCVNLPAILPNISALKINEMQEKEIWKDVVGYEGIYQVSDIGNVRSLDRVLPHDRNGNKRFVNGKSINKYICSSGYYVVSMGNSKNHIKRYCHKLVLEAFTPNPENKLQGNHIDGIKSNNKLSNLEWVTPKENIAHAFRIGLARGGSFGKFGEKHHRSKAILQFDKNNNYIAEFGSIREAARSNNLSDSNIVKALKGTFNYCGSFIWKYKNIG